MSLPRHPLLRPHLPVLVRLAIFGTLLWAVLHATVVAGVMATGGAASTPSSVPASWA